jgi:hypothetical protein
MEEKNNNLTNKALAISFKKIPTSDGMVIKVPSSYGNTDDLKLEFFNQDTSLELPCSETSLNPFAEISLNKTESKSEEDSEFLPRYIKITIDSVAETIPRTHWIVDLGETPVKPELKMNSENTIKTGWVPNEHPSEEVCFMSPEKGELRTNIRSKICVYQEGGSRSINWEPASLQEIHWLKKSVKDGYITNKLELPEQVIERKSLDELRNCTYATQFGGLLITIAVQDPFSDVLTISKKDVFNLYNKALELEETDGVELLKKIFFLPEKEELNIGKKLYSDFFRKSTVGEYKNKAFTLDDKYNWNIKKKGEITYLIPTLKDETIKS